jgi:hypothetical protein
LDCAQLKHWNIKSILDSLANKESDYSAIMNLSREKMVMELPRKWNDLDNLTSQTKLIHMTERLTQPWKTGLKIDFTRKPLPKLFGVIPREPVARLLGKYPSRYQPHPKKEIEQLFFTLVRDALRDGAVSEHYIREEIAAGHVRADLLERIKVL